MTTKEELLKYKCEIVPPTEVLHADGRPWTDEELRDLNCKEITEGYELTVVECCGCGFHLGVDLSYLEQVGSVKTKCPGCALDLTIDQAAD